MYGVVIILTTTGLREQHKNRLQDCGSSFFKFDIKWTGYIFCNLTEENKVPFEYKSISNIYGNRLSLQKEIDLL